MHPNTESLKSPIHNPSIPVRDFPQARDADNEGSPKVSHLAVSTDSYNRSSFEDIRNPMPCPSGSCAYSSDSDSETDFIDSGELIRQGLDSRRIHSAASNYNASMDDRIFRRSKAATISGSDLNTLYDDNEYTATRRRVSDNCIDSSRMNVDSKTDFNRSSQQNLQDMEQMIEEKVRRENRGSDVGVRRGTSSTRKRNKTTGKDDLALGHFRGR